MATTVALRILTNALDAVEDPLDTEVLVASDWKKLRDAIELANTGIDTAEVKIGGAIRLTDAGGASLVECLPDVAGTRPLGTGALPWGTVTATTYVGNGTSLSGVLLLAGGTMSGDIGLGGVARVRDALDPLVAQDYATKAYVDTAAPAPSARGDIITANAVPNFTNLAVGASGTYLRSDGIDPVYAGLDMDDATAGTLTEVRGGTGESSYTQGDLIIGQGATNLVKLSIGGAGDQLTVVGSDPAWLAHTDRLLGTLTVDLTITTKQNIYTVPSGKSATVTRLEFLSPNGTIGATTFAGIGWDAGSSNVIASMTVRDIDAATQYGHGFPDNPATIGAATDVIGLAFTNANTGTATTATARIIGREF